MTVRFGKLKYVETAKFDFAKTKIFIFEKIMIGKNYTRTNLFLPNIIFLKIKSFILAGLNLAVSTLLNLPDRTAFSLSTAICDIKNLNLSWKRLIESVSLAEAT